MSGGSTLFIHTITGLLFSFNSCFISGKRLKSLTSNSTDGFALRSASFILSTSLGIVPSLVVLMIRLIVFIDNRGILLP